MLGVREPFPSFALQAVVSLEKGKEFQELSATSFPGKWLVVFFWPMDFTLLCPTEITAFGKKNGEFVDRDTQVLGASVDSQFVHLAWRKDREELRSLPFPMLADNKRALSSALGILHPEEGVALRATYIVDPQGIVRWACANDMKIGRSVDEVLRVLDALQTDELCPCGWKKGEPTQEIG